MYNKQKAIIAIFIITLFTISCNLLKNNYKETTWQSNDGKIICYFTSLNTLEINFNNIKKQFLYYEKVDKIIITNVDTYLQFALTKRNNELILDSEAVKNTIPDKINTEIILEKIPK